MRGAHPFPHKVPKTPTVRAVYRWEVAGIVTWLFTCQSATTE